MDVDIHLFRGAVKQHIRDVLLDDFPEGDFDGVFQIMLKSIDRVLPLHKIFLIVLRSV